MVARRRTEPPYCPEIDEDLKIPPVVKQSENDSKDKKFSESNQLQMINEKASQDGTADTNNAPSEPTDASSRKTNFMDMKAFKQKFANSNSNGYKGS